MRSRKVTAHYCDHCNKRGFQIPAMEKHEKTCTANTDRECGMCEWVEVNDGQEKHGLSVIELSEIVGDGSNEGLRRLRDASNDCPACMLAAVRYTHNHKTFMTEEHPLLGSVECSVYVNFDWRVEKEKFDKRAGLIIRQNEEEAARYQY